MTLKREKFCVEYLIDLNGTQATIRAGYSERTAAAETLEQSKAFVDGVNNDNTGDD